MVKTHTSGAVGIAFIALVIISILTGRLKFNFIFDTVDEVTNLILDNLVLSTVLFVVAVTATYFLLKWWRKHEEEESRKIWDEIKKKDEEKGKKAVATEETPVPTTKRGQLEERERMIKEREEKMKLEEMKKLEEREKKISGGEYAKPQMPAVGGYKPPSGDTKKPLPYIPPASQQTGMEKTATPVGEVKKPVAPYMPTTPPQPAPRPQGAATTVPVKPEETKKTFVYTPPPVPKKTRSKKTADSRSYKAEKNKKKKD